MSANLGHSDTSVPGIRGCTGPGKRGRPNVSPQLFGDPPRHHTYGSTPSGGKAVQDGDGVAQKNQHHKV